MKMRGVVMVLIDLYFRISELVLEMAFQASQVTYHRCFLAHSCLVKSFQVIGKQQNGCRSAEDFEGVQIYSGLGPKSAQFSHGPASDRLRDVTPVILTSISALSFQVVLAHRRWSHLSSPGYPNISAKCYRFRQAASL